MASIRKIEGKTETTYKITVCRGYDVNGKKITLSKTFKPDPALTPRKAEKAVQAFARVFEEKVINGDVMDGRRITLQEFAERWLNEYAKPTLQPATVVKYEDELNAKILPALGHMKLSALKPHAINGFFVALSKDGARRDGKCGGYSKGSILKTKTVLSSLLRTALEWEIIDRNPCNNVRVKAENAAERIKYFTPEQAIVFLQYIEKPYTVRVGGHKRVDDTGIGYKVGDYEQTREMPEQMKILFNLALFTGCRKGELVALQWSDVDFENDLLRISKAATIVGGKQVCKTPKTKTSCRTISFPHFLSERLKRLKADEFALRQELGNKWRGDNFVFIQADGRMLSYSAPYETLQDVIHRYNKEHPENPLPAIPFHGLRHTSATLLIHSRLDVETISHRLGHAQTSTTLNIYSHAIQECDKKASAALEKILAAEA